MALPNLDGFAGLAALVNSLLLWPIVRALKNVTSTHHKRLTVLERAVIRRKKKRK